MKKNAAAIEQFNKECRELADRNYDYVQTEQIAKPGKIKIIMAAIAGVIVSLITF